MELPLLGRLRMEAVHRSCEPNSHRLAAVARSLRARPGPMAQN